MNVKQLSTGWYYLSSDEHAGWAQPPRWPIDPLDLDQYLGQASPGLQDEITTVNRVLWEAGDPTEVTR